MSAVVGTTVGFVDVSRAGTTLSVAVGVEVGENGAGVGMAVGVAVGAEVGENEDVMMQGATAPSCPQMMPDSLILVKQQSSAEMSPHPGPPHSPQFSAQQTWAC